MKSLFPASSQAVEQIHLHDDHKCDVYTWVSPDGVKIAAHMIMACPSCGYPLSLATSEFDFEDQSLRHIIKCPARWKKTKTECVGDSTLHITELNEKGRPVYRKCGWQGYIMRGDVITKVK